MLRQLLLLLFLATITFQAYSQEVKLSFNNDPKNQHYGQALLDLSFDIAAIPPTSTVKWRDILALYVGDKPPVDATFPSMTGSYSLTQGNLLFTPRFAPVPDQSYTLVFNAEALSKLFHLKLTQSYYQLTRHVTTIDFSTPTELVQALPLTSTLPQNILRFYLYFSQSMSFDNPYQYLSLLDENNEVVPNALVELSEGLWDQQRTRLTVLIHPGRIKRGVGPNVKQGPVFTVNQRYRLKLNKQFKDFRGLELKADFYKDILISAPIYQVMKPQRWQLNLPDVDSLQPLEIKPEHLLDPVLALRMISLLNVATDTTVKGEMAWDKSGVKLLFKPQTQWQSGGYQLVISAKLEDLAGNTPSRVFDHQMTDTDRPDEQQTYLVDFKL